MSGETSLRWRPPYAYVPGQTARHDEALFDHLKDASDAGSLDALSGTLAFRAGMVFLAEGYFWEAHEMFESVWMACPPNSAERAFVQGLVQLANGGLKTRMQRPSAAGKLYAQADRLLEDALHRAKGAVFGVTPPAVQELVAQVHKIAKDSIAI